MRLPPTSPRGPDKVAPKPTTSTTTPQGRDDIAPKPPKGDDPKPNGPGDIANPQSDPVVGPGGTGNAGGHDESAPAGGNTTGAVVEHDDAPLAETHSATSPAAAPHSSALPTIVIVLVAGVVGALIALVGAGLAGRKGDEHAPQV